MKKIFGLTIGGLQQKIVNLVIVTIILLVAAYLGIAFYQMRSLTQIVEETGAEQKESITTISSETMDQVLDSSMTRTTGLQAYVANDMFEDVEASVITLAELTEGLFRNSGRYRPIDIPKNNVKENGTLTVQLNHEKGVDPYESKAIPLVANLGDIMIEMMKTNAYLDSLLIATPDGNLLFVDDRAGEYVDENGNYDDILDVRNRFWYTQAVDAKQLIFTGIEPDAFTDIPGIVCATPVYVNDRLVAVVGADIFLDSMSDYVNSTSTEGGFTCVIDDLGRVIFSPKTDGTFKPELSGNSNDLRNSDNKELAAFVSVALKQPTAIETIEIDGKVYEMCGYPMSELGWAIVSIVDEEVVNAPGNAMLASYDSISENALEQFRVGLNNSKNTLITATVLLLLLSLTSALILAYRTVKPLERMTSRIQGLKSDDMQFIMEGTYRTGNEIEVLAEAFADLSARTVRYIHEVTRITAEKERIGTELALANRIQADMLPNIFPAFPERPDFDVYASMTPAKEVGGDFYDFFLLDEDNLCLVMADVSGKGVPAALFMMISKTLLQNYAMNGKSPAEVLTSVNNQICSNNREQMFVTVWLGFLNLKTGLLTAANAGHEYPILKKPDGSFEIIKDKHGFVVGGMEGVSYKDYTLQMDPGAKLFVYTDGVAEATNSAMELFGMDRTVAALRRAENKSPEEILDEVNKSVASFVGEAPQFDDLTMLCLHYIGQEQTDQRQK